MQKIRMMALPLAAFASMSNSTEAGSQPVSGETPQCRMALPNVEIIENFKGSVSGPFILTGFQRQERKTLSLLSMNIQNIPFAGSQNPDYRADRMDCLKKLSGQFSIVAFQEDFSKRDIPSHPVWKPEFARKALLKTGSPGLSFQSGLAFEKIDARAYTDCSGLLGRKNDCLASKGYQVMRLEGVTIINTHLDAGGHRTDQQTRAVQLNELSSAIPLSGPVLLTGDFNLHIQSAFDEKILSDFLRRNDLTLFKRYSPDKGHDFVMGREIDINWIGKVEDPLLSDHAGLVVNFTPPEDFPVQQIAAAPR